jgi:hypothetical protein
VLWLVPELEDDPVVEAIVPGRGEGAPRRG